MDADWHRERFVDFATWEVASGGPDSHVETAVRVAREIGGPPVWFLGLYTAVYNVPSAEVLHAALPEPRNLSPERARELWPLLTIRKERRVNGLGPDKLSEIVSGYRAWLIAGRAKAALAAGSSADAMAIVREVPHHGRYFATKLYEALRRLSEGRMRPLEDLQPDGGRLTRAGLALLHPEHDPRNRFAGAEANALARPWVERLGVDWFQAEALFCEYRQAVAGGQYPGRALDSEMDHARQVEALNPGIDLRMWPARAAFPWQCRGEGRGWDGRRPLGKVMTEHDYVWSDLIYDYNHTTDLAHPARWEGTA